MELEDDIATDLREQMFHNTVRENVIFLLLFLLLYVISYIIILRFLREEPDVSVMEDDDLLVNKISLLLCTFGLAVSGGAAFLLPFSIASNEVLILYPNSYYVKWLNDSLVQGLWNHVFVFSNLSLFGFLPFAYFFSESEGFSLYSKGIKSRVYETVTILIVLFFFLLGVVYVVSAIIDNDRSSSIYSLLNFWTYYLPFLYSCISFLGVLMLLICTPLGFAHLFSVLGKFLIKPKFLRDIEEEYSVARLQEQTIRRRLDKALETGRTHITPLPMCQLENGNDVDSLVTRKRNLYNLQNGELRAGLAEQLESVQRTCLLLEKQRHSSPFMRNIVYPTAMVALLLLTVITVFMVLQNTIELLIGVKALPISGRKFTLGISSLSMLGPLGATLEVVLILYLIATSFIGLYSIPCISLIRPRLRQTSFLRVVINCCLLLVLSSALPLLSRTLGITNFDLLGDFGQIKWLGNFMIVLLYNVLFVAVTALCLLTRVTQAVRKELYTRMQYILHGFAYYLNRPAEVNPVGVLFG